MRYSSRTENIAGRGSEAWHLHFLASERRRAGHPVIFLTVGEPDFDTPPVVVDAAVQSMRNGNTHYTEIVGPRAQRQAIADWHRRTTGQQVDADQVVVAAGAQNALFCTMQVLVGPGDEVISPDPAYSTYEAVVGAAGATMVQVPLDPDRGFHIDLKALERAVTSKTRVILINTPHNPTGAVMTQAEVETIAAIAKAHDLWLVSDEVYASLTFEKPHVSPASLPGMAERTVVVSSLSKSHAMTGWRVGWAIGPEALARHLHNLLLCMLYGSPGFIQDAAVVAIREASDEIAAMRTAYRRRRDLVAPWLDRLPGLACALSEGGMFVMVDCRASGLSSQDFARRLLDEESVAILPADGFGKQGEGFLRISLGLADEELAEACRRIEAFCGRLSAAGTERARA
jgi:arginine:pyruvate transaminase